MGNIGGVSSSVEDGQTGADSSDGSGDGTQMGSITFSQDTVGYARTWVPFEDGFQLYLPSDWDVYNVTEEVAAAIGQGGYQVDDIVSINGIPCVSYRIEESDCSAIMFFHPTNRQYLFCVTGVGYAANVDTICSILTSVSLT